MNTLKSKLPPMGTLGPFIALIVACIFFSLQSDRFLSLQNFSLILQQVMVVGTIAIGQTLIILTAGIDLSCGMIMALGSIVMTKMAADYGLSAPIAIALGIGATALLGLTNGLLVTKAKLPPFIVTLGMLNIAFAITQLYSGSQTITDIPDGMLWLGNSFRIGETNIVYGVILMLALVPLDLAVPARDRTRAPHLRRGQQPRGHAPDRHLHRQGLAGRLCAGRCLLRHRVLAERGPHRRG